MVGDGTVMRAMAAFLENEGYPRNPVGKLQPGCAFAFFPFDELLPQPETEYDFHFNADHFTKERLSTLESSLQKLCEKRQNRNGANLGRRNRASPYQGGPERRPPILAFDP